MIDKDKNYTPQVIAEDMINAIRGRVGSNWKILDPMCGDGALFRALAAYGHDTKLFVGRDIDGEAISKCRVQWPDANFEVADANEWNDNQGCDFIIMNPCFHQPLCRESVYKAFTLFKQGMLYVPFERININLLWCTNVILHEYTDWKWLEQQFGCKIANRQGYIYYEAQV